MFSNKTALAGFTALALSAGVHAQEKHLTLDDIDGLARQNIVDSMRKSNDASKPAAGVGLNAPLTGAPAPDTSAQKAPVQKPSPSLKRSIAVSFVGAYSDASGSYALYDYQGAIYPAKQGSKLLNGWVLGRVDGFVVNVSEGKRKWTEVIAAQAPVVSVDSSSVQAINDLSGPLPPAFPIAGGGAPAPAPAKGGASVLIPFGK
jgi:hypothetical protein